MLFYRKKLWLYLYQTKLKGIVFYNPRSSENLESYCFHRQQHFGRIYHINLLTGIVQIFKSDNKDLQDYRSFKNRSLRIIVTYGQKRYDTKTLSKTPSFNIKKRLFFKHLCARFSKVDVLTFGSKVFHFLSEYINHNFW